MTTPSTRRTFLGRALAAGVAGGLVPFALPGCALPPRRRVSASRLRHASVGVGGMGAHDLARISEHADVDIVALCDVDQGLLRQAAELHPGARLYTDWRALLEAESGLIDSLNVTTPDHMHAPVAMSAMRADLHVYVQKPLSHTVLEARRLTEVAAERGLVTQMGIQNHSGQNFRRALEVFRRGVTGPVEEVHVWTDRAAGWWPQDVERPEGSLAIPVDLDWNGWLGVAPPRPYAEGYHTFAWRGWKDFGTGAQGDMGCHLMEPVPWFLEVGAPLTVHSEGPPPNAESYPEWSRVRYTFAPGNAACARDGVELTWHDGGRLPDELLAAWGVDDPYANAAFFVGAEGALLVSPYEDARLFTVDGEQPLELVDVPEIDHWHDWVEACFGRREAATPFATSGPLTELVLLGNVALEFPEETLAWDAPSMRFPDRPEADALVHKRYRRGWEVAGLAPRRSVAGG